MRNPFESSPLVQHTRELGKITGRSHSVGWIFDEPAFFLYGFVKFFKPELIIQTGHLWGKSAEIMLEALNDGFLEDGAKIEEKLPDGDPRSSAFIIANSPVYHRSPKLISIDPFIKKIPHQDDGIEYLKQIHPNFEFHRMRSIDFFSAEGERLKRDYSGARILGFVDGDHSWGGALYDMEYLVDIGAEVIIVDDTIWLPHLGRAAREFAFRHPAYQLLDLTLYTGTAVFWKKSYRAGPPKDSAIPFSFHELVYIIGGRKLWWLVSRLRKRMNAILG